MSRWLDCCGRGLKPAFYRWLSKTVRSVDLFDLINILIFRNLLTLTTPVPDLLRGLTQLKKPPLLVAILASMYRYISVLATEFSTMRRAAASRNLMARPQGQRRVFGNMLGALFVRSYGRGDRVYQAMLARGYTGVLPTTVAIRMATLDWVALGLMGCLAGLGQLIWFIA